MRNLLLTIIILCTSVLISNAQTEGSDTIPEPQKSSQIVVQTGGLSVVLPPSTETKQSRFNPKKLILSGGLGFSWGYNYTAFNISPQVGYAFNKYVSAGAGVTYNYLSQWGYHNYQDFSANYLGMNTFVRLTPVRYIAFQAQPEIYRLWGNMDSRTVPCFLVGVGTIYPAGRGGISAMIYYDVVQNNWSPYGNQPFYSVGYIFSF